VIPALGSGRYSPGPNIGLPSWRKGLDPNFTINVFWGQPGTLATVSRYFHTRWRARAHEVLLANVLQSSSSTFSCVRFPRFFAFKEGMWDTHISVRGGWPIVPG